MRYIKDTTDFFIEEPTAISLGKFDGIHRGHELLLEQLLKKKKEGYATVIFTFDIPPKKALETEDVKVLTTNEEKMHMFDSFGIDYLIECPFTPKMMSMEAETFIEMLVKNLSVKCIVAGDDFHFGYKRRGDYKMLQEYAQKLSYEAIILPKMKEEERDISSTFVREEIAAGRIEMANKLLGYPYFVSGEVKHGNRIGRTIGFPTINLIPPTNKLLPAFGVYITKVTIDGIVYHGITNVGCKPTIEGDNPIGIETHIFDFNQDVYDKIVIVTFIKKIREERKFSNIEKLLEQMRLDVNEARYYFSLH
ncbi:MAG: bifunctional riboflavin kinase/FAD synthetase [Roseburia sp.]|nr:bifunctional riboflavin kinase/FAD synthetase [Roseburia sp.]